MDDTATAQPNARDFYRTGRTTVFASRVDQRFSYCLYVPTSASPHGGRRPLVVLVHGTERGNAAYRDAFVGFAEEVGCVVLCPLFPAGIGDPGDLHNYKFLAYDDGQGEIRFDHVLLGMVGEVAQRYHVDAARFVLHGFSGGGQFAHRFFYLHPHRLAAVSIGAPGRVTLLDDTRPWWVGTGGMEAVFGQGVDVAALRQVAVHMVVGDRDTETWEINNVGESNWMEGAQQAGTTRIQRLRTLAQNYRAHGITVDFDLVPGLAHHGTGVHHTVHTFLTPHLTSLST